MVLRLNAILRIKLSYTVLIVPSVGEMKVGQTANFAVSGARPAHLSGRERAKETDARGARGPKRLFLTDSYPCASATANFIQQFLELKLCDRAEGMSVPRA